MKYEFKKEISRAEIEKAESFKSIIEAKGYIVELSYEGHYTHIFETFVSTIDGEKQNSTIAMSSQSYDGDFLEKCVPTLK